MDEVLIFAMLKKYAIANCVTSWKDLERCMKCKEFEGKYWKFAGMCLCNVIKNLVHRNMYTWKLIPLSCNTLEYIIQESSSGDLLFSIIILHILKNLQTEILFSIYLKCCTLSVSFCFSTVIFTQDCWDQIH